MQVIQPKVNPKLCTVESKMWGKSHSAKGTVSRKISCQHFELKCWSAALSFHLLKSLFFLLYFFCFLTKCNFKDQEPAGGFSGFILYTKRKKSKACFPLKSSPQAKFLGHSKIKVSTPQWYLLWTVQECHQLEAEDLLSRCISVTATKHLLRAAANCYPPA